MVITINGQDHELHFGMQAVKYFFDQVGILEEGDPFTSNVMAELIWGALQNGAYRQKKTLSLSFADVLDFAEESLLDESRNAVLEQVQEEFAKSRTVQKLIEKAEKSLAAEGTEGDVKKKEEALTSTNLKPSASAGLDGQNTITNVVRFEPSY